MEFRGTLRYDGFLARQEVKRALYSFRGFDDVLPASTYALSEEEVTNWEVEEDQFEEFEDLEGFRSRSPKRAVRL